MTDFSALRGINYASMGKSPNADSSGQTFTNLANATNPEKESKTAPTLLLEDFTDKFDSFHGENRSNITAKDAKESFLPFLQTDNIFASKSGQELLKEKGNFFQRDIFQESIDEYGGVKYGNQEDLIATALNFAKADIKAIAKAFSKAQIDYSPSYKYLDYASIYSFTRSPETSSGAIEEFNLDGKSKNITAEEYASFMISADANKDGIIKPEEKEQLFNSDTYGEFMKTAQGIYDTYYSD